MSVLLLLSLFASAQQYKILNIYPHGYIKVGGKYLIENAIITDKDVIDWGNNEDAFIKAQDTKSMQSKVFTAAAMKSRNVNNIAGYVKLSSKNASGWQLQAGVNKERFEESRIALVIGNSNYDYHTLLQNPLNDARAVSDELKNLGFDVVCVYDGTKETMNKAINAFIERMSDGMYGMAFIYFSGHGLQYENKNWLLPIDANIFSGSDVERDAICGNTLCKRLSEEGNGCVIMALDACRTIHRSIMPSASAKNEQEINVKNGMLPAEPLPGLCLAFATQSGTIAQDDPDELKNGPYATALVNALKKPSLTIDQLFNDVKEQVYVMSNGTQMPIHTNSIVNTRLRVNGRNLYSDDLPQLKPKSEKKDLKTLAMEGDKKAQYDLGQAYEYGISPYKQNSYEAFRWYLKSAYQGYPKAENKVGSYYFEAGNYQEALQWFLSAAKSGNVKAQYNAGSLYMRPEYGYKDYAEGRKWLEQAAANGEKNAQFEMGYCLYHGIGMVPYSTEAVKWFQQAALQEHVDACYYLGECYYNGEGISQNYVEAVRYYEMAANGGNVDAQYALCDCYEKGVGTAKNPKIALKWCEKAKNAGHKKAGMKYYSLKKIVEEY